MSTILGEVQSQMFSGVDPGCEMIYSFYLAKALLNETFLSLISFLLFTGL